MSFGFPAYFRQEVSLPGTPVAIFDAVTRALNSLKWKIKFQSADAIEASSGVSFWSWGEKIFIRLLPNGVSIESKCAMATQCIDWGKNKRNVKKFLAALGVNP